MRDCPSRLFRHSAWILALLAANSLGFGQATSDRSTEKLNHAADFAVSPPLRDLAKLPQPPQQGFREINPVRRIPKRPVGQTVDTAEQGSVAKPDASYSIVQNFLGVGNGFPHFTVTTAPPSTNMAVGDTQVVQWVNVSFTVCDKSTTACGPAIAGNTLWNSLGGICAANNDGDIIAQWDAQAHRWLLTQNVLVGNYGVCVAVSTSSDANGSYFLYQFPVVANGFPDYSKWGVWTDNYGQTWNNFGPGGSGFVGPVFCAYNRTKLLAGDATAEQICHQYSSSDDSLLPADIDSPTPPPAGEDQFAIGSVGAVDQSHLSVYSVHINNPGDWRRGATFTGDANSQLIPIAAFTPACDGAYMAACVPQKGITDQLNSLGDRLMYRFVYYSDDASFPPIKPTDLTVFQQGTYAPDGNWRWMGSMAADQSGDILVGYSESCGDTCPGGTPTFPSIYVAGRLADDPLGPGKLESEVLVVAGTGSQPDTSNRWGDFSAMRIDNNDGMGGCTFWYTTEYYMVTQSFDWSTQIASARFADCFNPPPVPKQHWYVNFDVTASGGQNGVRWMEFATNSATQTTVISAPNPSVYFQPVTIAALVTTGGNGTPTGTVDFADTFNQVITPLCTAVPLDQKGKALCSTSVLAVGTHTQVVATYNGDNNFSGSNGTDTPPQTVLKANSTTAVTSVPDPSQFNQLVTFTAVVTGEFGGTPTGTVDFRDNQTPLCTAVSLDDTGTATCQIQALAIGAHNIIAIYSGDLNFTSSQGQDSQTVTPAATTTVLSAVPPSPSSFGQLVTFTATVTGAFGGSPTGTVDFTDNKTPIPGCTGAALVPQQNGSLATCQTTSLAVGSHTVAAAYNGDSNFTPSGGSIPYTVVPATTTTTLSVSPPSPVPAGQVVTLTATVASGSSPVTVGTVTFSSGAQVLGTVQLVHGGQAAGTATLRTRFAPGSLTLTAQYNGTSSFQSSQSSPQPYTVTGTEPTISTLSATPDGNNYDFALSVFGFGFPPLSGSATLNNLTQGGSFVGTINLPGPGMSTFQPQQTYPTASPFEVAVSDFNGDGIADLAVTEGGNAIGVLLGNGDGTFQAQSTYATGSHPYGVAVGDFNGDGIADLAISNTSSNTVSVLLGNGDGTFQPQQTYPVGNSPGWVAIADFNGDGIADLAVTNPVDNTVSVLLGNGNGTFQPQQTYATGAMPLAIVTSDFNGDGIPDLAVTNVDDSTVSVLLGNGDGTFQQQLVYATGAVPFGLAVADFNGDGFADLATADQGGQSVSVLLGKGNGTFQPAQSYQIENVPVGVAVADFNGDGILDLAATNAGEATVSVLLGNGDGTFQPQQIYPTGLSPYYLAVGDFNGDGVPDLAVPNLDGSTLSILLGGTVSTGQLNNVPVFGVGNQNIQSTFTPNGTFYASSLSNIVPVGGEQIPTATTLSSSQNPSSYLQPVTFTATVTDDGGSPTGTVTFTADGNVICAAVPLVPTQNGSTATCLTSSLAAGTHNILAGYSGDSTFAPSSGHLIQTVTKSSTTTLTTSAPNPSQLHQAVTITAVVSGQFGGTPTGTVNFSDGTKLLCMAVLLDNSGKASCQTQSLAAGTHQLGAFYSGDNNFSTSSGSTTQTVNNGSISTSTQIASSLNPSAFKQPVTFTATVTAGDGSIPSGSVTFQSNGVNIPDCSNPANLVRGVAACTTQSLAAGNDTITASFGDPQGIYGSSSGTLVQMVGDFNLLVSPGSVTVTQGYNNTNDPFFAQTINLTAQPLSGYNGTVVLSCSVNPTLAGGSCAVNPPSSGSLATGNLNTTLAISASSTTPIGPYTVTVTAQDGSGLMHLTTLSLVVINDAPGITEPPGGAGRTPVSFNGPSGMVITNLACTEVTGTGIAGSEDLGKIGGVCTFNPGSVTLPGSVVVTISGCTVARLGKRTPVFAVFLFGLPAMVLLGAGRGRGIPRNRVLQWLGTLLLLLALSMGVGCGGSGSSQLTPTGSYLVLVQGTASDGGVYSAVVPVTVSSH